MLGKWMIDPRTWKHFSELTSLPQRTSPTQRAICSSSLICKVTLCSRPSQCPPLLSTLDNEDLGIKKVAQVTQWEVGGNRASHPDHQVLDQGMAGVGQLMRKLGPPSLP